MVTRVVYNNKAFKILNEYSFKFSNNEVTFNDITIDFTDYTYADIPYKYQEIKIIQSDSEENILNGTVLFTGYLDEIKLSEMKMQEEYREITLTLLSPLKMATRRCVSLIGTYKLKNAITRILQPLIDDGFELKELNVADGDITTNYILETVENCMNNIGSKRNIFWYINEKKEIFINSIDYLFGLPIVKKINQSIKEKGLLKIQPEISNVDYANVINIKNIRLFYSETDIGYEKSASLQSYPIINLPRKLKNGDIIYFNNPIVIDENTLRNTITNEDNSSEDLKALQLQIMEDGYEKNYFIGIKNTIGNVNYDKFLIEGNLTYSDSSGEEGEIVLQKDGFFSNLITGFKWNGNDDAYISEISSMTALRYTTMRFMHSSEINKLKGVISKSGQVEKTIDYNGKWTTVNQLIDYAGSLIVQNSNIVNQIVLEYDINPNLNIGDIVNIDAYNFYCSGNYAVKDITYTYYNNIKQIWQITLKSTDLISTYIDMFRPNEKEENEDNINTVILSEFVEEVVKETHKIEKY